MRMENLSLNQAHHLFSTWIALEVLSPESFLTPKDLLKGKNQTLIKLFDSDILPWEKVENKTPDNTRVFYHIVIGTIKLRSLMSALSEKYSESTFERPQAHTNSLLAVVVVDQNGFLLDNYSSFAVSSFAWGAPLALKGNLKDLGEWCSTEKSLLKALDMRLRTQDINGMKIPLNRETIEDAYDYLVDLLELPVEFITNSCFAIKVEAPITKQSPPPPLRVNSFYLNDLIEARFLVKQENIPQNLERYLGIKVPLIRKDILNCRTSLEEAVSPKFIPPARWPGSEGHALVLLQQAAVNLGLKELKTGGILAVNGPPGTGKTTLLRDVIAEIISQRAEAMCSFDDPSTAFIASKEKVKAGQGSFSLYTLNSKLKGFEILVASSNNKAIENITTELPRLKAISQEADELRYFNCLADKLYGFESWGLISAVLGNKSNRYDFTETFWWDTEVGLKVYLAEAAGLPQTNNHIDPLSGMIIKKIPKIIQLHTPPRSRQEALKRWREARSSYQSILAQCNSKLMVLEKMRSNFQYLDSLDQSEEVDVEKIEELIDQHEKLMPGFFSRFFRTHKSRTWRRKKTFLNEIKDKVVETAQYRGKSASHIVEKQSFDQEGLHHISPWCDQEMQLLRDQVFIAAIKLHKAFIDASSKPLRHNLAVFMMFMADPKVLNGDKQRFVSDLWSSFFLVTPCVSTTFASINSLLIKVPPNSLGWLLIDEAGQATPQSAVGAIMRTQRAIIIGDPMQIEPIVTLPRNLTKDICKQFDVDPERFNAPDASVQTLADSTTSYYAEFECKDGSRSVGIPLLVHRRCSEPMFSIANAIAYDCLMVKAKCAGISGIRDCLGPSTWFDIQGESESKWCSAEGEKLIEILFKLKAHSSTPDLFIVTPFTEIRDRVREMIKESCILQSWRVQDDHIWLSKNVGTVHTMQGREAEAVIILLGAPSKKHKGARNWAGLKPNLLNVAITRAKEAVYVIGNKALWSKAGVFKELSDSIGKDNH